MNILCVCGNGIGTSVLLKINVEQAADNLGMDVNVTTSDAGSAKGTANMSDLVLTSPQLAPELEGTTTPVETVENFMDLDEITGSLETYEYTSVKAHSGAECMGRQRGRPMHWQQRLRGRDSCCIGNFRRWEQ